MSNGKGTRQLLTKTTSDKKDIIDPEKIKNEDVATVYEEMTTGEEEPMEEQSKRENYNKNNSSSALAIKENRLTSAKSGENRTNSETESADDLGYKNTSSIARIFNSLNSSENNVNNSRSMVNKDLADNSTADYLEKASKNIVNLDDEEMLANDQAEATRKSVTKTSIVEKVSKGRQEEMMSNSNKSSIHLLNEDEAFIEGKYLIQSQEEKMQNVDKVNESVANISTGQDNSDLNQYLVAPKASVWLLCLSGENIV